jgi:hypothetical protein
MHNNRPPKNDKVRENPAGENNREPMPLPKEDHSSSRRAPSAGNPLPIPSTRGYVGKRIK